MSTCVCVWIKLILFCSVVALSAYMAIHELSGWGWFLFLAIMIGMGGGCEDKKKSPKDEKDVNP